MSTTTADVIRDLRDAMTVMREDALMTADCYTSDAAHGDDASQAECWAQWCACIRRRCIGDAMYEHLTAMRNLPTGSHGSTLLDLLAVANDADHVADGFIASAIASAREGAPDSWVAIHGTIL